MFDIIAMGSATVDAFADTDGDEIIDIKSKSGEEKLIAYPYGGKILIKEMRYDIGGNGVNAAVGMSRLGLKTGYLGKIGKDVNGRQILERLENENIPFTGARGEKSGFSVILDSHLGDDRTILTFKGCNNDLEDGELDWNNLNTKWLYLSSMLGESFRTMRNTAHHVKNNRGSIVFAPSSTLTRLGMDHCRELLVMSDLLILNDSEATDLVGEGEPEENLRKLKEMVEKVVVTMGEEGLIAMDGENFYRVKPTEGCEVVETTGAGDACASGIVAGVVMGKDFATCLKMGMNNSESVLCHYGAHNKLLDMEEMEEKLASDERVFETRKI